MGDDLSPIGDKLVSAAAGIDQCDAAQPAVIYLISS
jgi:hypothetical protein